MKNENPKSITDPAILKAMRLYGLEFGFDFLIAEGTIAKFRSPGVLLMKMPISQCLQALKERGYDA